MADSRVVSTSPGTRLRGRRNNPNVARLTQDRQLVVDLPIVVAAQPTTAAVTQPAKAWRR